MLESISLLGPLLQWFTDVMSEMMPMVTSDIATYIDRWENTQDVSELYHMFARLSVWYFEWSAPLAIFSRRPDISGRTLGQTFCQLYLEDFSSFPCFATSTLAAPALDPRLFPILDVMGLLQDHEALVASVIHEAIEKRVLADMLQKALALLLGSSIIIYAKTSQIFDIIVDYPDSRIALTDLRNAWNEQMGAGILNNKRLLHPGADTKDILTQYVSTIRCLRILDPPGVLLFKVADPIRRYLRERPDTIRCIVSNLVGDGSDLLEENEQVLPIQALNEPYEDYNFRTSKPGDIVSTLVSIYDSRDLFVKELQSMLGQRLLAVKDHNYDNEASLLPRLIPEGAALQLCDVMLRDVTDSRRVDKHVAGRLNMPLHATIISHLFWPNLQSTSFKMPAATSRCSMQEDFEKEYTEHKAGKKLRWMNNLGTVSLDLELEDRVVSADASPLEAAVVELFSEQRINDSTPVRAALMFWTSNGVLKPLEDGQYELLERVEAEESVARRPILSLQTPAETAPGPTTEDAAQQTAQMELFWNVVHQGILTNLGAMPIDRIQAMLSLAPNYNKSKEQLSDFLDAARAKGLVDYNNASLNQLRLFPHTALFFILDDQNFVMTGTPDNRPQGPQVVIESAEFIVSRSKLVDLNHSGINRVAEQIDKQIRSGLYSPHTWSEQPLHHLPHGRWTTALIFFLKNPQLVQQSTGYFFSGERYSNHGPKVLFISERLSDSLIESVFEPASGCLEPIPLLKERIHVMREAGTILVERYGGSFAGFLAEWREEYGPKAAAGALVAKVTRVFEAFRDEGTYKDTPVFFWKRAQILVAETWAAFYPPPGSITIECVPQILHHLGTIDYSPILVSMLLNGENLPNGSEAEMSIRAAGILAVEGIKNRILDIRRRKPAANNLDSEVCSVLIDFFLWTLPSEWRVQKEKRAQRRLLRLLPSIVPEVSGTDMYLPLGPICIPDRQALVNFRQSSTPFARDMMAEALCQSETSVDEKLHQDHSTSKDLTPSFDEKSAHADPNDYFDDVKLVKGQPVIETGAHVSNFAVDVRDDGDPSLTLRSFFIGTVVAGLGAALSNLWYILAFASIYNRKGLGNVTPKPEQFESRIPWLAPIVRVINPGPYGLKEHVVATLIATTAAYGATAVNIFAVQRLFYNAEVNGTTAVLATFSTACFGYGLVGLLRPLTVYPSEMVYWGNLPTVTTFQALHWDTTATSKRLQLFWSAFWCFPLLNGFSVFCLASQKASTRVREVFTNVFGGVSGNEGLGILSLSFDWQYIGSTYMSLPLIQQGNSWIGYGICYVAMLAIYYSNTWDAKSFPMLSTSIFGSDGKRYNQTAVFGPTFTLNHTALEEYGLPHLTGSNVWANMTACWSIGGLIAHCLWFWRGYVVDSFRQARTGTQPDRHWVAMQRYKECPWWWYVILLVLSFFAGLIVIFKGNTTLPWWGYILSLAVGVKIPPRIMFITQMWGTLLGAFVNYAVMASITSSRREVLLNPIGTNVWSGATVQSLNSAAVTWSLAGELYGPHGPYKWVPIGLALGMIPTTIQYFIWKRWPKIGPVEVDKIMLPVIYMYAGWFSSGVNSITTSIIIVGLASQVWLRRRHPGWYNKYNYILGGGLDGGTQTIVFILSFAVYGASGIERPFPNWWGNPADINPDYCL
ncbi:Peptide transporter MTD1 [Rhizoctonia solani]|uniref:Anaphase-promoting complex subunit 2 n=1 Tax=Rhizoctonia solani TaxID=456999 RepID=A0A8H7M3T6_9AGAM|nr:Peptide transporter MTD1 [Rhizoctonia solani]